MRTIPNFGDYMEPIEDILNSSLIPTLFGSHTPFPDHFKSLFSLPSKGALGIPLLKEEAREQYYGSKGALGILVLNEEAREQYYMVLQ